MFRLKVKVHVCRLRLRLRLKVKVEGEERPPRFRSMFILMVVHDPSSTVEVDARLRSRYKVNVPVDV
jgi:hypothetical protein